MFLLDLRYGMRTLAGQPGFSAAAVIVLALGIGANASIFSLVDAFLLKPLRIEKPEQIVGCYSKSTDKPNQYRAFSYPEYVSLRTANPVFSTLLAHDVALVGVAEGDSTHRTLAEIISSNYFEMFGVPLFRGREFTHEEERPGRASDVAIVSYRYWKRQGENLDFLGKTIRVNSRLLTVVGIAAEGFSGSTALINPEIYLPLSLHDVMTNDFDNAGRKLASPETYSLMLAGRLRPNVTAQTADSWLAQAASQISHGSPSGDPQTYVVHPLSRISISTNPQDNSVLAIPAVLLLSMSGVVLLIASLNVANMMLARSRRKEISIRMALGGSRRNILQQMFIEGFLLALLGGVAGILCAYWSTEALVRSMGSIAPVDIAFSGTPDVRILIATLAFSALSTLVFAVVPAWGLSKIAVFNGIKDGDFADVVSHQRSRLFSKRNVLVMAQVSLSLVLLSSAGLFLRSAQRAANLAPGFRIDGELIAEIDPSLAGYGEPRGREIYRDLLDRLRSIPAVDNAAIGVTVPFGSVSLGRSIQRGTDDPVAQTNAVSAGFNIVSGQYFKTLDIPLLRGRTFTAGESLANPKSPVAILDQSAAARLWPEEDAIGKRIRVFTGNGAPAHELEIVGVVGHLQTSILGEAAQPFVYIPFGQEYQPDATIHLATSQMGKDAQAHLLQAVRAEIAKADPRVPILTLRTFRQHLESSAEFWIIRMAAQILSIFGAVALLMAMAGLYGVRAYSVARRTREIGIRMALGANPADALSMILREGMAISALGTAFGLALSLGVGKMLSSMLYNVSAADPVVLLVAPLSLAAISLLACYLPARRASRIDPMVALRFE